MSRRLPNHVGEVLPASIEGRTLEDLALPSTFPSRGPPAAKDPATFFAASSTHAQAIVASCASVRFLRYKIAACGAYYGLVDAAGLHRPLLRIGDESNTQRPLRDLRVDLLALDLLVQVMRRGGSRLGRPVVEGRSRIAERVDAVRRHLDEHACEETSLRLLSKIAEISPYYLSRAFKQRVGVSPYQYLLEQRVERAKALLRQTRLTTTQICFEVGFGSLPHFINTFRKRTGLTPTAYRKSV